MAFDFNQFNGGDSKRPFSSLGLNAEQVESILQREYGLSEALMQEFPDITKRADATVGSVPLAFMKAGIIFENQRRDTTFDAIAEQLGTTDDTAYQYMVKFREAVRKAFGLEIVVAGDSIRIVNQQTALDAATRVLDVIEAHVKPAMKKLDACTESLAKQNNPVLLPAKAQAYLDASRIPDESVA
jgi:hypothetical protein